MAVTFKGSNLQDATRIVFRSDKLGGRVIKATPYQVEAAEGRPLDFLG
jgi:hypothetical protein